MTLSSAFIGLRSALAKAVATPQPHTDKYRTDIDGLRALAVLAVVFFHAGIGGFDGGYVGVDMFFVISGYLITNIIRSDQSHAGFSFAKFYERRVRRILPALYAVMAACFVVAIITLVPQDLKDFSRSSIATSLFISNIFFWNGTGYFAAADQTKPLLHTWSLAVEEQFYLFYPPLLVGLSKRAQVYLIPVLATLWLSSFLLNAWGNTHYWTAAFFLSPSRGWELLLGCLIAFVPDRLSIPGAVRESLAVAALAAIAYPIFMLGAETSHPILAIALPCFGVAALIFVNTDSPTVVGRLLSLRALVWIGLISYSLYLWHWPIIVFARQVLLRPLTAGESWALISLSIVSAALSWRFIEKPFRGPQGKLSRNSLFAAAGATTLLLVGVASVMLFSGGFPQRYSPEVVALLKYDDYDPSSVYRSGTCFVVRAAKYDADKCNRHAPGKRTILVWGDSHAAHYFYGEEAVGRRNDFSVAEAALSGCLPLLGPVPFLLHECQEFNAGILARIDRDRPDEVILSGHWNKYYQRDATALFAAVDQSVALLVNRHVRVVFVGPSIEYQDRLPILITRAWAKTQSQHLDLSSQLSPGIFELDRMLRARVSKFSGVTYISVLASICPRRDCPVLVDGSTPMIWDTAHLTSAGSAYVVQHAIARIK